MDAEQEVHWSRSHARRYLEARYGQDVWYRAPETFGNAVERWLWALAAWNEAFAEEQMAEIEEFWKGARRG